MFQPTRRMLGLALESLWKKSGLTQEKFAGSINVSRSTISHAINAYKPGTKNPVELSSKTVSNLLRNVRIWKEVERMSKGKAPEGQLPLNLGEAAEPKEEKPKPTMVGLDEPSEEFLSGAIWLLHLVLSHVVGAKKRASEPKSTTKAEPAAPPPAPTGMGAYTSKDVDKSVETARKGMTLPQPTGVMPPRAPAAAAPAPKPKRPLTKKEKRKPKRGHVWVSKDKRRKGLHVRVGAIDAKNDRIWLEPVGKKSGDHRSSSWHRLSTFIKRYRYVRAK